MAQRVARLHRMPRPRGPRGARRLLPAHRRQAGRLSVQPAAQFPRRAAPLRADERLLDAARRRLPARDRGALRVARPAVPAADGAGRRRRRSATPARPWCGAATPARGLPACNDCHGAQMTGRRAVHPGPARPAARLPERPARRLAQRPATRAGARLHGAGRAAACRPRTSARCRRGWRRSRCRRMRPRRRAAAVAAAVRAAAASRRRRPAATQASRLR